MSVRVFFALALFLLSKHTVLSVNIDETNAVDSTFVDVGSDRNGVPAIIKGCVLLSTGKPASSCVVSFELQDHISSERSRHQVTADKEGIFRVRFWASPQTQIQIESADGLEAAPSFTLRDVFKRQVRLEVKLCPLRSVRINVVGSDDAAVEGAYVALQLPAPTPTQIGVTDEAGLATFRIPSEDDIEAIAALKKTVGLDYVAFPLSRGKLAETTNIQRDPTEPLEFRLKLLGSVAPASVKVVDLDGQALPGVRVSPWIFRKDSEPDELNMVLFSNVEATMTDSLGHANLSWIPSWQKGKLEIVLNKAGFERCTVEYDPASNSGELSASLSPLVSIRGVVRLADGQAVSGVSVSAIGNGSWRKLVGRAETRSGEDGTFELLVPRDQVYLLTASGLDGTGRQLAAEFQAGLAVFQEPILDRDITVRVATRVFGTLVSPESGKPLAGQRIAVMQIGDLPEEIPEVKEPVPNVQTKIGPPRATYFVNTNVNGEFEFALGDGTFKVILPEWDQHDFTISGEPEYEVPLKKDGSLIVVP